MIDGPELSHCTQDVWLALGIRRPPKAEDTEFLGKPDDVTRRKWTLAGAVGVTCVSLEGWITAHSLTKYLCNNKLGGGGERGERSEDHLWKFNLSGHVSHWVLFSLLDQSMALTFFPWELYHLLSTYLVSWRHISCLVLFGLLCMSDLISC